MKSTVPYQRIRHTYLNMRNNQYCGASACSWLVHASSCTQRPGAAGGLAINGGVHMRGPVDKAMLWESTRETRRGSRRNRRVHTRPCGGAEHSKPHAKRAPGRRARAADGAASGQVRGCRRSVWLVGGSSARRRSRWTQRPPPQDEEDEKGQEHEAQERGASCRDAREWDGASVCKTC